MLPYGALYSSRVVERPLTRRFVVGRVGLEPTTQGL